MEAFHFLERRANCPESIVNPWRNNWQFTFRQRSTVPPSVLSAAATSSEKTCRDGDAQKATFWIVRHPPHASPCDQYRNAEARQKFGLNRRFLAQSDCENRPIATERKPVLNRRYYLHASKSPGMMSVLSDIRRMGPGKAISRVGHSECAACCR